MSEGTAENNSRRPLNNPILEQKFQSFKSDKWIHDTIDQVGDSTASGLVNFGILRTLSAPCSRLGLPLLAGMAGATIGAYIAHEYEFGKKTASFIVWTSNFLGSDALLLMPDEGPLPATIGMQVAHDKSEEGGWACLTTGLLILGAGIAIAATGGLAAGPIIGGLALGAAGGILAVTAAEASLELGSPCGMILSGSDNVKFQKKPVARVGDDVQCTKCKTVTLINQGSHTVTVNGRGLARIGHTAQCGCVIADGVTTIHADMTTDTYGETGSGRSLGNTIAFNIAKVGLAAYLLRLCKGEPIDVVTGEYADYRTDFIYSSILPLELKRVYTGRGTAAGHLGKKWQCNWSQRLWIDEKSKKIIFEEEDGQSINYSFKNFELDQKDVVNPYYHLHGTIESPQVFDARKQQTLHFSKSEQKNNCYVLSKITDRNNNYIDFNYVKDRLISIIHSDGISFDVNTTTHGLIESLTISGEDDALVYYQYDENDYLIKVQPHYYSTFNYSYTKEGWLNGWSDNGPTKFSIEYDKYGRVVATKTPQGLYNDKFIYFPKERKTQYINAVGACETFWYDLENLVIAEQDGLGRITRHKWDRIKKRKLETIDPLGRKIKYFYNDIGEISLIEDWDKRQLSFDYDKFGLLTKATPFDGQGEAWQYDEFGNLIKYVSNIGVETHFSYDQSGRLIETIEAKESSEKYSYDALGHLKQITNNRNDITSLKYDLWGRLLSHIDAENNLTEYKYEASPNNKRGNVSTIRYPDGGTETFTYDNEGLLNYHSRQGSGSNKWFYGAFDLLEKAEDASGKCVQLRYDGSAKLVAIINETNQTWRLFYDKANQLVGEQDFAGRLTQYTYDEVGRLIKKIKANGEIHTINYDHRDRIISIDTGDCNICYTYNDKDQLIKATTGYDGNIEAETLIFYDKYGRISKEIQNGSEIDHIYDQLGRRINRQSESGDFHWHYDDQGLLAQYSSNGHEQAFEYNRLGLLLNRNTKNGFCERRSYDSCGRLIRQNAGQISKFQANNFVSRGDVGRTYHWDKAGRLTQINETDNNKRYFHDNRDQVIGVENNKSSRQYYDYNALMNLVNGDYGKYTYDPSGDVIKVGDNYYKRDVLGRVLTRTIHENGFRPKTWQYQWNSFDQLVAVITPDNKKWRYIYDAFGRRVLKECLTPDYKSKTSFLWDGDRLSEEWTQNTKTRWHYEEMSFAPLAKEVIEATGENNYYPIVTDHLGTPKELFDSHGKCHWRSEAALWGKTYNTVLLGKDKETHCRLRFQGQYEDDETGLFYNLNRYYDPLSGMYLTNDPIGLEGGLRPQGYVHNPTTWIDPLGLENRFNNGNYNTFFTHDLDPSLRYASDSKQFRAANKDLVARMNADPRFKANMMRRDPDFAKWAVKPDLSGSPKGFTWHHDTKIGRLQLVSFKDHRANHKLYHPNKGGGRDLWGGGKAGRIGKLDGTTGVCIK